MKLLISFLFLLSIGCTFLSKDITNYPDPNVFPATDFLINDFNHHDIILLGEFHRIKEYPEFVASIIPTLHKNNINILFSEFAYFDDFKYIDSLINGVSYDESLAMKIQYDNSWDWAFKEYVDIYFSAWKLNHSLKDGEEHFKIIGLERRNYGGLDNDKAFARLVKDSAIIIHKKALVYCGINHAFSKFNHPYVINGNVQGFVSNRMGNLLYQKYPDKVSTIILHGPWSTKESFPYDGMPPFAKTIDSIAHIVYPEMKEFGFNTNESWLGNLRDRGSFYCQGYDSICLKNYCQGYIVLKPICELSFVTIIPDFINNSNIEETRRRSGMNNLNISAFNDSIKSWHKKEASYLTKLKEIHCY